MARLDRVRNAVPIALVLLAAAGVRLPGLGWLPSAAGDEGNWSLYALRILRGEPTQLAADAAFVSMLYAHLMAAAMKLLGLTFFAARLPNALAGIVTASGVYFLLASLGSRRAGLAAATTVALHPWSVLYSRICSVPYELALCTMLLGPLLFVAGVLKRGTWWVVAGVLLTALGADFSPLCVVAAAACALFCLPPERRWVFHSWPVYVAAALALLHVLPIVRGAARVAATTVLGAPSDLSWRLWSYVHMIGTGLMGEASLRHFTSHALPAWPASVLMVPAAVLAAAAFRRAVRAEGVLAGFGPLYLAVGVLLTPLVLGAGRDWHMPYNHSDRYLFAVLPGFLLCLAELAHAGRARWRWAVVVAIAWMGLGTVRVAHPFLFGSGVDHGELIFDGGGGYRGWLVSDRPRNTLLQIRDHLLNEAGPGGAALLVADRVFIPMEFVLDGTGIPVYDVRRRDFPEVPQGRYFLLLWPDPVLGVGNPPTTTPRYVGGNERLRRRMELMFGQKTLVRRFVQRDGAPLLELWRAEQPRGRLRQQLDQ
jgi:hypothetical protein